MNYPNIIVGSAFGFTLLISLEIIISIKSKYFYVGFGWGGQGSAVDLGIVAQVDPPAVAAITLQSTQLEKTTTHPGSGFGTITLILLCHVTIFS